KAKCVTKRYPLVVTRTRRFPLPAPGSFSSRGASGGSLSMANRDTSDDRVLDIIEKVGVCMLTTRLAVGLRARPLEMRSHRATGSIWFLTDARSAKDHEIANAHDVGLVVIDSQDSAYLSITGRAEIFRDSAKAADIWKATD